jgi:hydroxypyruvate reductase/glycerate 2-kinase
MCQKDRAKEIFLSAVEAVKPKNCIKNSVKFEGGVLRVFDKSFDLGNYNHIYLFGSGKASIQMAKEMEDILGEVISGGVVISNQKASLKRVDVMEGSHPIISNKSIDSAKEMVERFEKMGERDFFIYLLSGGSSAMMELPAYGLSLEELQEVFSVLLKSGMSIEEMNVVRKHLSLVKGGCLASKTKADGVVLVISDVVGDDLKSIGSAPLYYDDSTLQDAKKIVDKYNLFDKLPQKIKDILSHDRFFIKKEGKIFPHIIVASNITALKAAKMKALKLGCSAKIVTDKIEGDVKEVAKEIVSAVKRFSEEVLLFGGESTVVVKGDGVGGRNSELSLWVLKSMDKKDDFTFLSGGSDGIDGNSKSAGGVVCMDDLDSSIDEYLKNNDSYHYLKERDSLVTIGKSGTNVMDIMVAIKEK